jgi:hypothetical protein
LKLPRINLKELEKLKEDNFKGRLDFIDMYVERMKKSPNKRWSFEQKDIVRS